MNEFDITSILGSDECVEILPDSCDWELEGSAARNDTSCGEQDGSVQLPNIADISDTCDGTYVADTDFL